LGLCCDARQVCDLDANPIANETTKGDTGPRLATSIKHDPQFSALVDKVIRRGQINLRLFKTASRIAPISISIVLKDGDGYILTHLPIAQSSA
jgi:hypothetical protein